MRFDSPAITNAACLLDVKDDFDVLYAEAAVRRRMMSISTHDRISGIPGRVKLIEEFIKYAQKQKGVVFMRQVGFVCAQHTSRELRMVLIHALPNVYFMKRQKDLK